MSDHETFESEEETAEDRRLSALLRATHAKPNPAVWQRVRAELAATDASAARSVRARGFDAVLAWFTRPAALAAATAALAVSLGAGYGLLDALSRSGAGDASAMAYEPGTLMESLLDDATAATEPSDDTGGELEDSDGAAADSGGHS